MAVEIYKTVLEAIKDMRTMFVFSLLITVSSLLQRFLEIDLVLALGITGLVISSIALTIKWFKNRDKQTGYFASKYDETMKKGREALDRTKRNR